jgi:hypothetical protein
VVKDVLAKNNVTALEPFLCSLNLPDLYLLPRLKLALEGTRFYHATGIINNAAEELKNFHKMASRNVSNTITVAGGNV